MPPDECAQEELDPLSPNNAGFLDVMSTTSVNPRKFGSKDSDETFAQQESLTPVITAATLLKSQLDKGHHDATRQNVNDERPSIQILLNTNEDDLAFPDQTVPVLIPGIVKHESGRGVDCPGTETFSEHFERSPLEQPMELDHEIKHFDVELTPGQTAKNTSVNGSDHKAVPPMPPGLVAASPSSSDGNSNGTSGAFDVESHVQKLLTRSMQGQEQQQQQERAFDCNSPASLISGFAPPPPTYHDGVWPHYAS